MEAYLEPARSIPIAHRAEVVVVGGGVSGICAAIAAARSGADTLLVERYGALGGNLTIGLLEASMSFHDRGGKQIIGGIPDEIIRRLQAAGGSPGHVVDDFGYAGTVTPYDPEELKMVCLEMAQEAGVRLLLHTWVVRATREDGRIANLIVENKSGRSAISAEIFVDCSGDADVAALADAEFLKGRQEDGQTQPMSILFKLGNIDIDGVLRYVEENPSDFKTFGTSLERLKHSEALHLWGFGQILLAGHAKGLLPFKRSEMHVLINRERREAIINATRFAGDGTSNKDLTQGEIVLRQQVKALVRYLKDACPGFQDSYLMTTAMGIQVRESRRIVGEYTLTLDDVVEGRRFPDTIAMNAFPCDLHLADQAGLESHKTQTHYIPYGCLVAKGIANLLVAGRCVSGSREALAAIRQTAPAMAMGQAAGTAAALCVRPHHDGQNEVLRPRDLPPSALQAELRRFGAILPPIA